MIGKQRFGKKVKKKRLVIRNKFQNPPVNRALFTAYRAPLRRDGMSTLEEAAKRNSLAVLDDQEYEGLLGEKPGLDLSRYGNAVVTLDDGVSSVEQAEKERDAMRQAERYNAGILTEKEKMLKQLYKKEKERKKLQAREKIIQWLSLYDEQDQIPAELREEVNKFKNLMTSYNERYHSGDANRGLSAYERSLYDEYTKMKQAFDEAKKTEKDREKKFPKVKYTGSAQAFQRMRGSGQMQRTIGWKAPRIHEMLTPLKRTLQSQLTKTPEEILEERKKEREERETEYKEQQTKQRGIEPPKEMVSRAVPKTAEPAYIPQKFLDSDHIKLDVIPHPFILRKRKYTFMPVPAIPGFRQRLLKR